MNRLERAARASYGRHLQPNEQVLVTVDGFQFRLEDGGWMLIRFSGTEPIIRVYCETMHADKVDAILQDGLKVAGIK